MAAEIGSPVRSSGFDFLVNVVSLLARMGGLVLLVVGLWVGIRVIGEAWDLYREPQRIETFAAAVERGSNLDKTLLSGSRSQTSADQPRYTATGDDFRPSYFLTWFIVLALLLILGRLAAWAVISGGQLAVAGVVITGRRSRKTG
jgi:hypothetical protein